MTKRVKARGFPNTRALRQFLIERDGPWCHWCGVALVEHYPSHGRLEHDNATLDHLIHRNLRASAERDFVISCRWCNAARKHQQPADFLASEKMAWRRLYLTVNNCRVRLDSEDKAS